MFSLFPTNRDDLAKRLERAEKAYFSTGNEQRTSYKTLVARDTEKKKLLQSHDRFIAILRSLDPQFQDISTELPNILSLKKIYDDLPALENVVPITENKRQRSPSSEQGPGTKKQRTGDKVPL